MRQTQAQTQTQTQTQIQTQPNRKQRDRQTDRHPDIDDAEVGTEAVTDKRVTLVHQVPLV